MLGRILCTSLLLTTGCFSVRPDTPTAGITLAPPSSSSTPFGQSVTFTATVSFNPPSAGTPVAPTKMVTFFDKVVGANNGLFSVVHQALLTQSALAGAVAGVLGKDYS